MANANSPAFFKERLEANRQAMIRRGEVPLVLPDSPLQDPVLAARVVSIPAPAEKAPSAEPHVPAPAGALRLTRINCDPKLRDHVLACG